MEIEIKIEETGYLHRFECLFCEDTSEKEEVLPFVYLNEYQTRYVLCHRCIQLSRQEIIESLHAKAISSREWADHLDAIAANLPAIPSPESLRVAQQQYAEEWLRGLERPETVAANLPGADGVCPGDAGGCMGDCMVCAPERWTTMDLPF